MIRCIRDGIISERVYSGGLIDWFDKGIVSYYYYYYYYYYYCVVTGRLRRYWSAIRIVMMLCIQQWMN